MNVPLLEKGPNQVKFSTFHRLRQSYSTGFPKRDLIIKQFYLIFLTSQRCSGAEGRFRFHSWIKVVAQMTNYFIDILVQVAAGMLEDLKFCPLVCRKSINCLSHFLINQVFITSQLPKVCLPCQTQIFKSSSVLSHFN